MGTIAFSPIKVALAAACLCVSVMASQAYAQAPYVPSNVPPAPLGGMRVTGQAVSIVGPKLQLALRNGRTMAINLRIAEARGNVPQIYAGEFLQVQGRLAGPGKITAAAVMRAKSAPAAWSPDTP
jgi:hypothetical protein